MHLHGLRQRRRLPAGLVQTLIAELLYRTHCVPHLHHRLPPLGTEDAELDGVGVGDGDGRRGQMIETM